MTDRPKMVVPDIPMEKIRQAAEDFNSYKLFDEEKNPLQIQVKKLRNKENLCIALDKAIYDVSLQERDGEYFDVSDDDLRRIFSDNIVEVYKAMNPEEDEGEPEQAQMESEPVETQAAPVEEPEKPARKPKAKKTEPTTETPAAPQLQLVKNKVKILPLEMNGTYDRTSATLEALQKKPSSIEELAALANALYLKKGRDDQIEDALIYAQLAVRHFNSAELIGVNEEGGIIYQD